MKTKSFRNGAGLCPVIFIIVFTHFLSSTFAWSQTAPVITQDLTNQSVLVGSNVSFSVGVSGPGPFLYQWQFNGTNVPGNLITLAGGGSQASGNGPATNASLYNPNGVAVDSLGNCYIADSGYNMVLKIDTNQNISTLAGTGSAGYAGDGGAATNALLSNPFAVAVDLAGNVFVADAGNNCIRRIGSNGVITTVAGNGTGGYFGDNGNATNANLNYPSGIAVDANDNLFIADTSNQCIRMVGTNGIIMTIAGTGTNGYSGDGGPATNAMLSYPFGLALDANDNIYIADTSNNCIRVVSTNGMITTLLGAASGSNGVAGASVPLLSPTGVTVDQFFNVFIADTGNGVIRELTPTESLTVVAGYGQNGFSGASGVATLSGLNMPSGVALDAAENLYIGDSGNNRVRQVIPINIPTYTLTNITAANAGSYDVVVANPYGSVTSSVVFLSVVNPVVVNQLPATKAVGAGSNAVFSVTASGTTPLFYQWFFNNSALLNQTNSTLTVTAVGSANAGNYQVVVSNLYSSATSSITTLSVLLITQQPKSQNDAVGSNVVVFAGTSAAASFTDQWYFNGVAIPGQTSSTLSLNNISLTNSGTYYLVVSNSIYGVATSSIVTITAGYPPTITLQPQNQNYLINQPVTLTVGVAGTGPFSYQWQYKSTNFPKGLTKVVAGLFGSGFSGDGGLATNAYLSNPHGLALDTNGDLFIADTSNNRIREITPAGFISTVAGQGSIAFKGDGGFATNASLSQPQGVTVDSLGNIFVADSNNNRVRKVNTNGVITTVAGGGYGSDGGAATNAQLENPQGVAVDVEDDLLIADTYDSRVRAVVYGIIVTVAGGGNSALSNGIPAQSAFLYDPASVISDDEGNLYIADTLHNTVRKVDENGNIFTIAGNGTAGYIGDGAAATNAELNQPRSLALDALGNLYIADSFNSRIRVVATNGIITTVAGGGQTFPVNGTVATNLYLNAPSGLAIDPYENLFVATSYAQILEIPLQGPSFLISASNLLSYSNYDVVISNSFGSVTSSIATLTPVFGPAITTQPQSQAALSGSNVLFTVTNSGTGPFSYQWYFNGQPLPAQTSSNLTIFGANTNNAGNYQVVISSPYAAITSSMAGLTIVLPPSISPSPVPTGGTATLTAASFGPGPFYYQWVSNGVSLPISSITTIGGTSNSGFSGDGGPATNATLYQPVGIALDNAGNVYFTDASNARVRVIKTNGIIATVAGGGSMLTSGILATQYYFQNPTSLAFDNGGNLYVADSTRNRVYKIGVNGILNYFAGNGQFTYGSTGDGGFATNATLSNPSGVTVDAFGNVFIADLSNYRVRKVGTNGIISTVVGTGVLSPAMDGCNPLLATVDPRGVTMDSFGDLYIADANLSRIRRVQPNGPITNVAGGTYGGDGGPATNAYLNTPYAVAVDGYGQFYIPDSGNNRIRKVIPLGVIGTVAGTGSAGFIGDGGIATSASLYHPEGVAVDAIGNLYIADTYNNRIRKVTYQSPVLTITNVTTNTTIYSYIVSAGLTTVSSGSVSLSGVLPPQNLSAAIRPGQGVVISFSGTPSITYVLQSTTNLIPPVAWQSVATNSAAANGVWSYLDATTTTNSVEFYRAYLP